MKKRSFLFKVVMLIMLVMPLQGLNAEEVSSSKRMFTGNDVILKDSLDSSAVFLGNNVTQEGGVNGISFIVGNETKISGSSDYLLVLGNNENVYSTVEKDAVLIGYNVNLRKESIIKRDAYIYGVSSLVAGSINRNLFVTGDKVEIKNAIIDGDVKVDSKNIIIGENVLIRGSFKYNENAKIEGKELLPTKNVSTFVSDVYDNDMTKMEKFQSIVLQRAVSFIGIFITGMLICLLFSKAIDKLERVIETAKAETYLRGLGHGFLVLFTTPLIAFLFITTTIGMPLGFAVLGLYLVALYISRVFIGYVLGYLLFNKLLHKKNNKYVYLLTGLLIITIVTSIPYLAGVCGFIFMMLGLGTLFNLIRSK
ncbi:MAG: hypothetical protein RSD96_03595 [Bacilli bacterium]